MGGFIDLVDRGIYRLVKNLCCEISSESAFDLKFSEGITVTRQKINRI